MDPWAIVHDHLKKKSHSVDHQLDSFNLFCSRNILKILKKLGPFEHKQERNQETDDVVKLRVEGVKLTSSNFSPFEAVSNDATYSFKVFVHVVAQHIERSAKKGDTLKKTEDFGHLFLCSLPAMVKSKVCAAHGDPWDDDCLGGYFVVNGRERYLPLKEEFDSDVLFVYEKGKDLIAKLKGIEMVLVGDTSTEYHGEIEVKLPGAKHRVPLCVALRALGVLSDKEIVAVCLLGKDFNELAPLLVPSVHASGKIFAQGLASAYVGEFDQSFENLAFTLGRMARKLLLVKIGAEKKTDTKSLENIRLKTCGEQLSTLFKKECLQWKEKWASFDFGDVKGFVQEGQVIGKNMTERLQKLEGCRLSTLRRCERLSEGLHGSHFGFYDVVSTTEIATMTRVTKGLNARQKAGVMTALSVTPLQAGNPMDYGALVQVIVDGVFVGVLGDLKGTVSKLNELRMNNMDLNFSICGMELNVRTSKGRLQRPLFYVTEEGFLSCDIVHPTKVGPAVRFLDSTEVGASYIALNKESFDRHTHMEIHGSLLFGEKANAVLVFGEHMPISVSRASADFQCATQNAVDFNPERFEEVLQYGEIPLVSSAYRTLTTGANVVVAVMNTGGDSIVVNRGSVQRGLFRSFQYVTKYSDSKCEVGDDAGGGWKVDAVFWTHKNKQKVRLKKECAVDFGTVLSSRTGGKRVVSCLMPEEEMPFSENGLVPDLIINPLDVETCATLFEGLLARIHVAKGSIGDGTSFQKSDRLEAYSGYKEEIFYDGKSGVQVQNTIFVGPMYYRKECGAAAMKDLRADFGADEKDILVGHGLASVVKDAYTTRGDEVELVVDQAGGVQALHNSEMGVLLAPEFDGPVAFDGQLKPTTCRRHANKFATVKIPKATHRALNELRAMNVQMRFITSSSLGWRQGLSEKEKNTSFRTIPTEPVSFTENKLFVYDQIVDCGKRGDLFSILDSKDRLARVMLDALDIEPSSDLKVSAYNQEKLDLEIYANMDWKSAQHTLLYCFKKMNGGVLVRFKGNKVANFFPIQNTKYNNDFHDRLSLDGKEPASAEDVETMLQQKNPKEKEKEKQRPAKWVAVGNMVGNSKQEDKLAQLYDMLVNTCSHAVVHDCVVVFNRSEYPFLGAKRVEANPSVYGKQKALDSLWKKRGFIPVLSACTSSQHADLPFPTPDDWELITQKYFAPACRNSNIVGIVPPWENRTTVAEGRDLEPVPVFFWRGVATALQDHPRNRLAESAKSYEKAKKGALIQPGVLQIHANQNQIGLSYVADKNLVLIHPAEPSPPHKITLQEQAKKYKFTFDVENAGASTKLGALFKLGFCVLRVEPDHHIWVETIVDRDGSKTLKGGDVEYYEEGWAYLSVKKDLSNLERTVQWCILNDEKCKKIAENGKRFYASYFTRQFVYEYIAANLNAISSRQKVVD